MFDINENIDKQKSLHFYKIFDFNWKTIEKERCNTKRSADRIPRTNNKKTSQKNTGIKKHIEQSRKTKHKTPTQQIIKHQQKTNNTKSEKVRKKKQTKNMKQKKNKKSKFKKTNQN